MALHKDLMAGSYVPMNEKGMKGNVPPGGRTLNWQWVGDKKTVSMEGLERVERPAVEQKLRRS